MSATFVIDCSVAMAWLFDDEATRETSALLDRMSTETALVPALWYLEVANVLALAERKGRISSLQSDAFLANLGQLGIQRDDDASDRAFTHLIAACRAHHLTAYDATYLDLAIRRDLPLATLDEDLRKIARKLGVVLAI